MSAVELFGWVLFTGSMLALALCGFCFWAFVICPEQDRAAEDWTLRDLEDELARQRAERETSKGKEQA